MNKNLKLFLTAVVLCIVLFIRQATAQFSITTPGVANTWDFDGLQASGTTHAWADNSTLAGFYNARQTSPFVFASYTVGTGSSNSGQLYSFGSGAASDRALGSVGSGTPQAIANILRLVNNTGSFIGSLLVTYTGEQWRDGGAAIPNPQTLAFYYLVSPSATSTFDVTVSSYTAFTGLNFVSPTFVNTSSGAALDGNSPFNQASIVATLTVNWLAGEELYFKWLDINDTGNDHGLAIDNLSITAISTSEINITNASANYLNNSFYDFGTVNTGTSNFATFTIHNLGLATLNVTSLTLTGASELNVTSDYSIPMAIATGDFATFTVSYSPTLAGSFTAYVTLDNDDSDENPYLINIKAAAMLNAAPEINVLQNVTSYTNNSSYSFGTVEQNGYADALFTIENTGTGTLTISTYSITGLYFSLVGSMPTTVLASSTASFTIRVAPTTLGSFTGSITLANNDNDEGSYLINLIGLTTPPTASIFSENFGSPGGTTPIASYLGWSSVGINFSGSGDIRSTAPSTGYFGATGQGNVFITNIIGRNFEISNINTTACSSFDLSFAIWKNSTVEDGSTLAIEVSADGINYAPLSISLLPTGLGSSIWHYRTATGIIPQTSNLRIRFTNLSTLTQFRVDDIDLQGICPPSPEINLAQNGSNFLSGTDYAFGSVNEGSTSATTFTIQNIGTSTLTVSSYSFTGASGYSFNSDFSLPMTILPGQNSTFTLSFVASSVGTFSATLSLNNDDTNENPYLVNLSASVLSTFIPLVPEINLTQNGVNFLSGTDYAFGSVNEGSTSATTFTIQNTGTSTLTVSSYSFTGSSAYSFSSDFLFPMTILPGQNSTFTLSFVASSVGNFFATLSLNNDDTNENPYLVNLSASVLSTFIPLVPEINLTQNGSNFLSGTDYAFGSINEGSTSATTFTIQNTGTSTLTVSSYSFTGASGYSFSSDFLLPIIILPGQNSTFTLSFLATSVGTFSGTLSLDNNDTNENPYLVNLSTSVLSTFIPLVPEINLTHNGVNFLSGTDYAFGSVNEGSNSATTFTIQNTGTSTLTVSSYSFTGASAYSFSSDFSFPMIILPGQNSTFTLSFVASNIGTFSATLSLNNDDTNENPYLVNVMASVVSTFIPLVPEINLTHNGVNFLSGTNYLFGSVNQGSTSATTFTIQNTGTSTLTVSSYSFTGASAYSFSSDFLLPMIILPGQNSTFTLSFVASSVGTFSGTLSLDNNDTNESPYLVNLSASVVSTFISAAPEINVKQTSTSIASGGLYDFGSLASGTKEVVFTIENTGNAPLMISAGIVTGSQFSLEGAIPGMVSAGATANFTVKFSSITMGTYVGSILLVNTDTNESNYVINFTASVPNSIKELPVSSAITMYPNPNKGNTLYFNKATDAVIYNALGAKVLEIKNTQAIDISTLENGIYMVNLAGKTIQKLIVAEF